MKFLLYWSKPTNVTKQVVLISCYVTTSPGGRTGGWPGGRVAGLINRKVGSGGEASHKQISDIGNSVNEMSSTPLEEIHLQPRDEEHMAPPVGHGERLKKLRKRMAVEKQKVITYI